MPFRNHSRDFVPRNPNAQPLFERDPNQPEFENEYEFDSKRNDFFSNEDGLNKTIEHDVVEWLKQPHTVKE